MTEQELYTREQAIADFREMWNWIAAEPGRSKDQFVFNKTEGFTAENTIHWYTMPLYCPACKYTGVSEACDRCKNCLVVWPSKTCATSYQDESGEFSFGLFNKWRIAFADRDFAKAQQLAVQIANLPIREEKKDAQDQNN